jgi:hypothetical protein
MVSDVAQVDVRAYDVGFGDCLLISITYQKKIDGRSTRQILIDFGSNKYAPRAGDLRPIAERIRSDSDGKLDVLVLTHRHRDHLSGFDPTTGGPIVAGLRPDLVLRPWTEVPAGGAGLLSAAEQDVLSALAAANSVATELTAIQFGGRRSTIESSLVGLAGLQLRNQDAMDLLDGLATTGSGRYLRYGDTVELPMVPGITVHVLGPPDPAVWPRVRGEAAESAEYWLGVGAAAIPSIQAASRRQEPSVAGGNPSWDHLLEPGPVRWLVDRLDEHQPRSTLRLVHALDAVLNNTSLILVFEVMGKTLLFPGDAQIENWSYALEGAPEHDANRALLSKVDLYKVGHHGSRNATPKLALFPLWAGRPDPPVSLMSTLPGFYDKTNDVPSDALVQQLTTPPFRLERTDALRLPPDGQDEPVVRLTATPATPFVRVA